jgi:hypothetical protein
MSPSWFFDTGPTVCILNLPSGRSLVKPRSLPSRALRLLREWGRLHRGDLEENWRRARLGQALEGIALLE